MHKNSAEAQMKIDMLLCSLDDLQPSSVGGIAALLNVSEDKAAFFLRFLAKYRFITYDETRKTAVICQDFSALK